MKATVFLVGAGPGDPGLITVKGRNCLQQADVVIYDYLASPSLLNHVNPHSEIIYVGKKGGDHTLSQERINDLLVEKAKAGHTVCRLKGGDPFIFGRGGEEAEALIEAGIPFEVVPGVTSAIAAPAYAGIPLTHRRYTATVAFVTGHEDPEKDASNIDYAALAKGIGTLVFLMGVKNLAHIVDRLVANGRSDQTPVAVVRWGTSTSQVTVTGILGDIVEKVRQARLKAPAIIVVGEVVGLRKTMKWFESRPLFGKRIVVTRAREQASDLVARLLAMGAECIECPTIRVEPMPDTDPMDRAIAAIGSYDWIVFTSANGVNFFFTQLFKKGLDVRALGPIRTAAIGPATAEGLKKFGLNTDILPESYRAESIVDAFRTQDVTGKHILLPRAAEARPVLPVELRKLGAIVDEVAAYRTRPDAAHSEAVVSRLREKTIDMITFTSSSTVKNFHALLPADRFRELMQQVAVASIGPITSDTAKDLGFTVNLTAETFTIEGLCQAIAQHYRKGKPE